MKARHLDKNMNGSIEAEHNSSIARSNSIGTLDRRDAERVPLRAYVSYVTDERMGLSRGQGWLVDLSKTGCKITGPLLMVGTSATLVIYVQDDQDPLCICDATVTQSDGDTFGVRFPKLKSAERQRLQELVLRYATLRGRSHEHKAFRIA